MKKRDSCLDSKKRNIDLVSEFSQVISLKKNSDVSYLLEMELGV